MSNIEGNVTLFLDMLKFVGWSSLFNQLRKIIRHTLIFMQMR